ncbi:MAG: VCBS repeat-containing protein [Planctomycetota bacterium]
MIGRPLLVGACAAVAALAPPGDVRAATRGEGDWSTDEVEAFADARKDWVHALAEWIATGDAPPFDAEAAQVAAPVGGAETRIGEVRVVRSTADGADDRGCAPEALRQRLLGALAVEETGAAATTHTKVIAVEADGDRPALLVRVEVGGDDWQVIARVRARFARSDEENDWRCDGLDVERWERVRGVPELFVERTAGVFASAPDAARLLGVGSDRWAQRLDDPALSAWFGHQGLAAGDVNGDGRLDLYVAMPSGLPNLLLVQQPDGTVRDVAGEVGLAWLDDTKGVLLVDVDADGHLDAVSALGHVLVVQRGDGAGAFAIAGFCVAPDEAPFYGIAAADVDADGDLDLYGARYVRTHYADTVPVPLHDARNGPSNHLFRNDGDRFADVTGAIGLASGGGRFSLQGVFTDVDGDRDPDLYVVNDFGRNQLFVLEDGRYRDRAAEYGVEDQGAGMGASFADFDQDGDLDLYVSNMYSSAGRRVAAQAAFGADRSADDLAGIRRLSLGNSLLVREGEGFVDRSEHAGVRMGRWAWGAVFCDLDADGYDDLLSPAGFLTGPKPGDL